MMTAPTMACSSEHMGPHRPAPSASGSAVGRVVVLEHIRTSANHPCSKCHANIAARAVAKPPRRPHDGLRLAHMENIGDCYQCHSRQDRDQLVLLSGKQVAFSETPKLCGQCHSRQYKDWQTGAHGKQTGSWRGTRHRFTCAQCHDPHAPKRPTVQALPPPPRPPLGIVRGSSSSHEERP